MRKCGAAALVAAGFGLAACSESGGSARCAIAVTQEVCDIGSTLRGAEPVQEVWTSAAVPEFVPQPLVDGRYVLTARRHHCPEGRSLPDFSRSIARVVEITGCVMRVTTALPPDEETYVGVASFAYAADGGLEATVECAAGELLTTTRPFGFDGTTLVLVDASEVNGPPEPGGDCLLVDTLELR